MAINGATLFIRRGGDGISQMALSDADTNTFVTTNVSLFSAHLITTAVDFTFQKSNRDTQSNWLLLVNDDGTLVVSSLQAEQEVKGFSLWTTDGLYKNVGVDVDDIYTVVEREINGVDNRYLEVFDFDYYTDAAAQFTTGLPRDTFTGLTQLEGESVSIIADGNILPNQTVAGANCYSSRRDHKG